MQEVTATVLGVAGRQAGNSSIYDVALSDGQKYSTFNAELAQKAQALAGQQVTARVNVEQKNKNGRTYTNYNLEDIAPAGQLAQMALPTPEWSTPQEYIGAKNASPPPAIPMAPPASNGGMPIEREQKIVKQSVMATAFNFVGSLFQAAGPEAIPEATEAALTLAKTLYGEVFSEAASAPTTPQEVAAQVPGVQVGVAGDAQQATPSIQW